MAYAQTPISLNFSDLGEPLKTYEFRNDTGVDVTITPGNAGANITWDFAALDATIDTFTIDLVNAATIPMHNDFPAANVATIWDSAINVYFFNSTPSGLTMQGIIKDYMNSNDSLKLILSIPDTVLPLPANYGDTWSGYSFGNTKSAASNLFYDTIIGGFTLQIPIDTVHIKHHQYKTSVIDAWGTMIVPNNNFPVLRQKDSVTSIDSVWGYADCSSFPPPYDENSGWYYLITVKDTNLQYLWWMKSFGVPVVRMNMFRYSPTIVANVEWAFDISDNIAEFETSNTRLFPNPARDFITIQGDAEFTEIIIYDLLGNEVIKRKLNSDSKISINISMLPDGLYFYNALGKNNKSSGKFVVKH
jgi:hypothetical protein